MTELLAKIKLLDDPDETIYLKIRESIIFNDGIAAIPVLEEIWSNSLNPLVQERIEEIIKTIQFLNLKKDLNEWRLTGSKDLAYGAYLIAKFLYADLSWAYIEKIIDQIKKDVWIELNQNLTALEKIRLLNHIIYDIYGFSANISLPNSPQNYFINNVLETKKGNAISLAILYISIAQRLNLPVFGVDLPKNFIACYVDQLTAFEAFGDSINNSVLFYINPHNRGGVFGRKEIDFFLKQAKLEPFSEYYSPVSNLKVIQRLVSNLMVTYEQMGFVEKANELNSLLNILE
jgi:regulator of sirC expression with transglutaminase-like and TPR domain